MKRHKIIIISAAMLLGINFQSCENANKSDRENDRVENRKEKNEQYEREVAKFKDETERRIQENNRRIRSLRNGNAGQESAMDQEKEQQIQKLENQNRTLQDKLNNFEADSKEAWEEFKQDFNRQMANIEDEIEELTDGDGGA